MDHSEKYKIEAQERWANTDACKEHKEKTKDYSDQKWNDLSAGMDQIMADFAKCMLKGEKPASDSAQKLVNALQNYITENYYHCTNMILAGLGRMYVADERFRNNINQHACGTAEYICEAIELHCGMK